MKKIYSLFALMGALAFTGCEPTEDDYNNNISFMTADQIKATITVEQQNGRNVNKVKVVANNGVPIQITNGVNTAYSSYAELLLFNEGVNTVYVLAQNPDGSVLTKEYEVNVEQMYYEVPEQYAILTGGTSKTWTWDTEVNGGAWGNLGYQGSSGEDFAQNGGSTWWSCPPADLSGQMQHSSSGTPTGEEDVNAYMVWSLNGTKIETFTPNGTLVRQGKFNIENYSKNIDGWSIGTLNTTAESMLFPWKINGGGYAPTEFQVIQLNEDKMVLVYAEDGSGGWSEATFWRFKSK